MNNIVPFSFDGNAVRIVVNDEDDPLWFVLADVCAVLEVGNASDVASRLDDDEKGIDSIDTLGGLQRSIIVNEPGLYKVLFLSRKPIAKQFQRWVTHEVLPSIRRTGSYHHRPSTSRDDLLAVVDRMVEPIKGRFIEHDHRLDDHENRLGAVEGKIVDLGAYKRRDFSSKDKARLAACIDVCYGGKDPVTGLHQITNGRGAFLLRIAELDHFNNLRSDNRIENALPMHVSTHRRKTAGENFLSAFNEFHRKRLEFEKHPGPLFRKG